MEKTNRELTAGEKSRIKKLVKANCANYDSEYGCLPLDCDCYMFGICYTNSGLCKYFHDCVMPLDTELEALFNHVPTSVCKQCGRKFPAAGKRAYCSESCAEQARREQTAARVRKHRAKSKDSRSDE